MHARSFFEMAGLTTSEITTPVLTVSNKINYVKNLHNAFGLVWEARSNPKQPSVVSQLVTPVMSEEKAKHTLSLIEELDCNKAYEIFASKSASGYRVVCHLNKIQDISDSYLKTLPAYKNRSKIILEFLNDVYCPSELTQQRWKIKRDLITFEGPSIGYKLPGAPLPNKINHFLENNVGENNKYGLALCHEDHKHACYYFFPINGILMFELYADAVNHHCVKHIVHNQNVTKAALKNVCEVSDVLAHIGFFLTRFDTRNLALTCYDGALSANLLSPRCQK